jgi:4-hydroxythreonine-4-phosphate dehydrogenase
MPISTIKKPQFNKIALTCGDPNGVGFEVTAKALDLLSRSKIKKNNLFFLFRSHNQEKTQARYFKLIDSTWVRITFESLDLALQFSASLSKKDLSEKNILIDLALSTSAAEWVFLSTQACLDKKLDSLVTAPLSKKLIQKSGFKQMGHTGIFKSFLPKHPLHMGFVGNKFNVMIATDHIQLNQVEKNLTQKKIGLALNAALNLKKSLKLKKDIAVLGLNPHAGEEGLLGSFEKKFLKKLPRGFVGPLVPDAAFLKKNLNKYSLFLCLYHDQGLIPFKMHHGQDSGVHVTVGLPFVRTSVDHGTAFDIYNKNLANPASMLEAINLNLKLLEKKNV